MKLRKFAKCSLAVALIFGSTGVLVGCKKDNNTANNDSIQYQIYKLAKESGVTDLTYEEWLVSIKGEKGETGAKGDKGDPGNNGSDGRDGATWLSGNVAPTNEGKVGDFYLDTTTNNVYTKKTTGWTLVSNIKGNAGTNGSNGQNGTNGSDGVSVVNINSVYGFTTDNKSCIIFTFTMSDGTTNNVTVLIPSTPTSITLNNRNISINDVNNEILFTMSVSYEDGTYENNVPVTRSMIRGNINYEVEGDYYIEIMYKGKTFYEQITIYDPSNVSVSGISNTVGGIAIWLVDGENNVAKDDKLKFNVSYSNGTNGTFTLEDPDANIDLSNFTSAYEAFEATITYKEANDTMTILPLKLDDLPSKFNENCSAQYIGNSYLYTILNGDIFSDNEYIDYSYYDENTGNQYHYYQYLSNDMLNGFDSSVSTNGEYRTYSFASSKLYASVEGTIRVIVYDINEIVGYYGYVYNPADYSYVSVTSSSVPSAYVEVVAALESDYDVPVGKYLLTEDMLITSSNVDFTTPGYKRFDLNIDGKIVHTTIELYDINVTNVRYISFDESSSNLTINRYATNEELQQFIEDEFVGKTLNVSLYESENGMDHYAATIEMQHIDYSEIDTSKFGRQTVYITYRGCTYDVDIEVMADISNLENLGTYNFNAIIQNIYGIDSTTLYSDNLAVLTRNERSTQVPYQFLDETRKSVIVEYEGETLYFDLDSDTNSIVPMVMNSENEHNTYIAEIEGEQLTIEVYGNIAVLTYMGTHMITGKVKNNELYVLGMTIVLNSDGTATIVEEY